MDNDVSNIYLTDREQDTIRWPFPATPIDSADDIIEHIEEEFSAIDPGSSIADQNINDGSKTSMLHDFISQEKERLQQRYERAWELKQKLGELVAPRVVDDFLASIDL